MYAPLRGLRVLVTRSRHQAEALSRRLDALGAEPREAPTIRIVDPPDRTPLLEAAGRLDVYDWVILTSVNGVAKLAAALREVGTEEEELGRCRLAAIGPATGEALTALARAPDVVPESYRAEALVAALLAEGDAGSDRPLGGLRILLARAAEARPVLPDGLRRAGARVDEVAAYVTRPDEAGLARIRRLVGEGSLDWVTFTASSTVRQYVGAVGRRTGGARVAAIGPITASTARDLGLPVDAVAEEYTIAGLVDALGAAAAGRRS